MDMKSKLWFSLLGWYYLLNLKSHFQIKTQFDLLLTKEHGSRLQVGISEGKGKRKRITSINLFKAF